MSRNRDDAISSKTLDSWSKGEISSFPVDRLPETALKRAENVVIDFNGVVRARGSFLQSGVPDLPANTEPLGGIFVYKKHSGQEGLITMCVKDNVANVYTYEHGSDWVKHEQAYDAKTVPSYDQISRKVVIANGIQNFSFYDIEDGKIKQLLKVADPQGAPAIRTSGFTGTNYSTDYFYRIIFNGYGGSTKMSEGVKVQSEKIRENWTTGQQVSVDITNITVPENAISWGVCYASVPSGSGIPTEEEYSYMADSLPLDQKVFTDTGRSSILDKAPIENSTEGVIGHFVANISGRLWMISKKDNDYVIYWSGDSGKELYFGTTHSSGKYILNAGSREVPVVIGLGRDNNSTTCINIITRTVAGQGGIWDVYATTSSVNVNNQSYTTGSFQFKRREGNDGTDAPFSFIHENNNAYYLSMEGFKSTGVKPNISGIQSTDIISSAIRDRVLSLSRNNVDKCYAAYYDEAIFWTMAYGDTKNNEIWVYDILHGGVWTIWKVPADCIFRWSVDDGESPSLFIRQGRRILRYNKYSYAHADDNKTFTSYVQSGLVPFNQDHITWVHLLKGVWEIDRAIGKITLGINLHNKNGDIIKSSEVVISSEADKLFGWGATTKERGGWGNRKWGELLNNELEINTPRFIKVSHKLRKNTNYISFYVKCETPNSFFSLSRLNLLYTNIGIGIEFLSQKDVYKI